MRLVLALVVCGTGLALRAGDAQWLPPRTGGVTFPVASLRVDASAEPAPPRVPLAEQIVGSTVVGAAGGLVGALAASAVGFQLTGGSRVCGDDACGFPGLLLGGLIGETVGIGLGAHLGNGQRGNLGDAIGGSVAALIAAGVFPAIGVHPPQELAYAIPAAQLAGAVFLEIRSARRRRVR